MISAAATASSASSSAPSGDTFLKRIDRHAVFFEYVDRLRRGRFLTDVVLVGEDGGRFHAHRVVLAACSGHFAEMFATESGGSNAGGGGGAGGWQQPQPTSEVVMKDYPAAHIGQILDYIYGQKIKVPKDELVGFLETAEKLRLKGRAKDEPEKRPRQPRRRRRSRASQIEAEVGTAESCAKPIGFQAKDMPSVPQSPTDSSVSNATYAWDSNPAMPSVRMASRGAGRAKSTRATPGLDGSLGAPTSRVIPALAATIPTLAAGAVTGSRYLLKQAVAGNVDKKDKDMPPTSAKATPNLDGMLGAPNSRAIPTCASVSNAAYALFRIASRRSGRAKSTSDKVTPGLDGSLGATNSRAIPALAAGAVTGSSHPLEQGVGGNVDKKAKAKDMPPVPQSPTYASVSQAPIVQVTKVSNPVTSSVRLASRGAGRAKSTRAKATPGLDGSLGATASRAISAFAVGATISAVGTFTGSSQPLEQESAGNVNKEARAKEAGDRVVLLGCCRCEWTGDKEALKTHYMENHQKAAKKSHVGEEQEVLVASCVG